MRRRQQRRACRLRGARESLKPFSLSRGGLLSRESRAPVGSSGSARQIRVEFCQSIGPVSENLRGKER